MTPRAAYTETVPVSVSGMSFVTRQLLIWTVRAGLLIFTIDQLTITSAAQAGQITPTWDQRLPAVELRDVHIDKHGMVPAWQEMAIKYLLRANLYMDGARDSDSRTFNFDKETTTVKELMDAFLKTYPAYTYTQDTETGVIWLHPETVEYATILKQKVKISQSAIQVPMYDGVLMEMFRVVSNTNVVIPQIFQSPLITATFNYGVDLSPGTVSVRDLLNLCCSANINAAFLISSASPWFPAGAVRITPVNTADYNPLSPPRAAALLFWQMEIGKTQADIPNIEEVDAALSDIKPQKRLAALTYLKATSPNYEIEDLINKSPDPQTALWAAIELKSISVLRIEQPFLSGRPGIMRTLSNGLVRTNASLALLGFAELAAEKRNSDVMDVLTNHQFQVSEIAAVKPDLIRVARQSKLVREKLAQMNLNDADVSSNAMQELSSSNLFTLVPSVDKQNE